MALPTQFKVILLSLLPQICFAALQPRPISTLPIDPHAAPKFDVAFLNHLPIGRTEAAYWVGTGSLHAGKGQGRGQGEDSREDRPRRAETEHHGDRRTRSNMQRRADLLEIQRTAWEDLPLRSSFESTTRPPLQLDQNVEKGLTPSSDEVTAIHRQSSGPYHANPLESSFLSESSALESLVHQLSGHDFCEEESALADVYNRIPDHIEFAYDALVYSWSRNRTISSSSTVGTSSSSFTASDEAGEAIETGSTEASTTSEMTAFDSITLGRGQDDFEPTSLLPTFKVLKLPSSPKHIPYPSTLPQTPRPSQSSPSASGSATDTLDPGQTTPNGKTGHSRGEHHLPTTDYLCMTPSPYTREMEEMLSKANRTKALRQIEVAGRGDGGGQREDAGKEVDPWDSLRHLEGTCLYHRQGWFTYAYCHGSHVRQFRGVPVQMSDGATVPLEDMSFEAYNLGLSYATLEKIESDAAQVAETSNTPFEINDMDPPPLLPLEHLRMTAARVQEEVDMIERDRPRRGPAAHDFHKVPDLKAMLNGAHPHSDRTSTTTDRKDKHLSLKWGYGTRCSLAGRLRSIEVQFHCRMDGSDEIAYVKEVQTCQYIMIVHTPSLCALPGFHTPSPDDLPSHSIRCRQIVPDDRVQLSMKARDWTAKLASKVWHQGRDPEPTEGLTLMAVRGQAIRNRVARLKASGQRRPEGIATPAHLYEWIDHGPPRPKQTPGVVARPIPEIDPVVVQVEDEEGEAHEITVEFVIVDEDDDKDEFNEWGDEVAKLPKAKRRKLTRADASDSSEDPEEHMAYVAAKRAENKARREKLEVAAREAQERDRSKDNNGLGAKVEQWWESVTSKVKAATQDAEENKDDHEREL